MSDYLTNLLKLQALDFHEITDKNAESLKAELRTNIPQPILAHYDRLMARGKKGVALVRNQVCTGCHMRLPIGTINVLMQHQDIQICDTCGRYLALADPVERAVAAEVAPAKPEPKAAPKTRKRKALAQSAA
jgi:predicted  nucleic acid-binding Zn-ribbon protein